LNETCTVLRSCAITGLTISSNVKANCTHRAEQVEWAENFGVFIFFPDESGAAFHWVDCERRKMRRLKISFDDYCVVPELVEAPACEPLTEN
jgi:hypothetical protein